jgi:hypothetical protein
LFDLFVAEELFKQRRATLHCLSSLLSIRIKNVPVQQSHESLNVRIRKSSENFLINFVESRFLCHKGESGASGRKVLGTNPLLAGPGVMKIVLPEAKTPWSFQTVISVDCLGLPSTA